MNNLLDRPTLGERYGTAADTADLAVLDGRCDADILLAAGFATQGDAAGSAALALWRMRETRDTRGFGSIVERSVDLLIGRIHGPGRHKHPRLGKLNRAQAKDLAEIVLRWWLYSKCETCCNRGHPLVLGTNRVDYSRDCNDCRGTGHVSVERVVEHGRRDHARWLADQFDGMAARIFAAMARKLAPNLDLGGGSVLRQRASGSSAQ